MNDSGALSHTHIWMRISLEQIQATVEVKASATVKPSLKMPYVAERRPGTEYLYSDGQKNRHKIVMDKNYH